MEITQSSLRALYTAVKLNFQQGKESYSPIWQKIATLIQSKTAAETYAWLGEYSRLREWIGDRQINRMKEHSYTIRNRKFEATEGIPREYIEDDQYSVLMPKFKDMGYAAATHPDELIFALLSNGFAEKCYDSQYFFDTDHAGADENGKEISVSNLQAGSEPPWFLLDTRRPLKPLIFQKRRNYNLEEKSNSVNSDHVFMRDEYLYGVDCRVSVGFGFWQMAFASKAELNEDNFDAAVRSMMEFKSEKGRPLGINPTTLVCGPTNRAAAKKLIEAEYQAAGASNTNFKAVELMVVPWLT